ncbi:MAG: radical SAM protein, partial [Candidatus Omnitrophica bacterium]|nr:radical SAM protein [Candidatus Omnitrophota bacterium]
MIYKTLKKVKVIKKIGLKKISNIGLNTIEKHLERKRLFSYPLRVDIVPTKFCNLKCIFCIQYSSEEKELSLGDFYFIANMLFSRIYQVFFCSGGEPFLNRNFMEFLDICRERRVYINIVSNGMLLSEDICKELIQNNFLRTFSFSVDGFKKETLESIRKGIDYN